MGTVGSNPTPSADPKASLPPSDEDAGDVLGSLDSSWLPTALNAGLSLRQAPLGRLQRPLGVANCGAGLAGVGPELVELFGQIADAVVQSILLLAGPVQAPFLFANVPTGSGQLSLRLLTS